MANPIEEFAKTRTLPIIPTMANPIEAFSASKTLGRTLSPTIAKTKEDKKKLTKWQWISKQLMKPVGTVAAETEALGRFIGTGQAYIPGKAGLEVLSGKRGTSFSDVWSKHAAGFGLKESTARKIGFLFDLTDDPFMFIGGGLTKLGKLATKVSSLKKAGKAISVTKRGVIKTFFMGEDIATKISKSGYTAEQLALAGTKLGQVEKGQRALLTALGKPIIKGTKIYEATQRFKAIVSASKVGDIARRTFSTKTGIKELDELVENFNNLSNYRKQEVITQAGKIERQIKKMSPDDIKMVVDAVEDPTIRTALKVSRQKPLAIAKISDDLAPLAKEARKYKSAEEFVKALDEGQAGLYVKYTPIKRLLESNSGSDTLVKAGVKPNKIITVYRGIDDPSGKITRKIVAGDYVATSRELAETYTGSPKDVVSMKIKVKDFYTEISKFTRDDIKKGVEAAHLEGVYNPNKPITKSQLTDIYTKATQAVKGVDEVLPKVNKQVVKLADQLEDLFTQMKTTEKGKGILKTELENYFPHIKANLVLKDRIKYFFSPKKYSAALGAGKERKILKLVKESGEEIIGDYRKLGLKKINQDIFRDVLEKQTARKVKILQKLLNTLSKPDVDLLTGDLVDLISTLKKNISHKPKLIGSVSDLVEPTAKELDEIIQSIVWPKKDELNLLVKDLEQLVKTSQGKEFLKPPLGFLNTKTAKIKWAYDEIIKTQNKLTDKIRHIEQFDFVGKGNKFYKRGITTISEINEKFGKEFFQSNPSLAYAQRGLASAKAVSAKEFLDEAGKKFFMNAEDAPIRFIESTNPLFKGLKAEPEIVNAVDQYIQGIQPEELKLIVRAFDSVQNWWKAQVLISPSYHLRNTVSNFWSNWLAGVKNPLVYNKARMVQNGKKANEVISITDAGEKLTRGAILKGAKQRDVIGRGWYGSDIAQALADEIGGRWRGILNKEMWKPWKQKFVLIKTNRAVGSAIEDNARLAHYIDKLQKGFSADDAARSVKKFLFDYSDLSPTEKNIFKRLLPFYTWTRKNIPLQIENLIVQPEKFAAIPKVIEQIEAGVDDPKTDKYMSEYITENIPVKVRTNEKGNTEYFLLGNWLPAASAIDVLSNPIDTLISMTTPLLKTPYELWANKSTFFKNTLGESSKIEFYYKQPTEFMGIPMRRKAATLMRNIRVLNDLNKLVKTPAKDEPENSWVVKMLDVMFGRAVTYDIKKSRYFYQRETTERINELKAAIKKAQKMGEKEHAQELADELRAFQKERGK